ncbi:MAG: hypothetical protein IPL65_18730 [Lewinellaceae bacterium]|nr:hypothetical protein [Lewinellaceae bacterium]
MRRYPAKLLLFGEHVLLLGAPALAVPVPAFGGSWQYSATGRPLPKGLLESREMAAAGLDLARLEDDLFLGLYFDSNIPDGYGLGSSGALCAALYDQYALEKTDDMGALKAVFSTMESFFHGKSSGIDPLTSYFNRPILIDHGTEARLFGANKWTYEPPVVFLIDSQLPRKTEVLVKWFLENAKQSLFSKRLREVLFPALEDVLEAWSEADSREFWKAIKVMSAFQLSDMPPMVPATLKPLWESSLDNPDIALKLCGAGGGGYLLGFAKNTTAANAFAKGHTILFPFEKVASDEP